MNSDTVLVNNSQMQSNQYFAKQNWSKQNQRESSVNTRIVYITYCKLGGVF